MKLNSLHTGVKAMKEIFYSRQHFPKILGISMFSSCVGGYMLMANLHQKRLHVSQICIMYYDIMIFQSPCLVSLYILSFFLTSPFHFDTQEQSLAYEEAWGKYNRETELRTEKYDKVITPTLIQRRRMTKSTSYTILGSSKDYGLNQMMLSPE